MGCEKQRMHVVDVGSITAREPRRAFARTSTQRCVKRMNFNRGRYPRASSRVPLPVVIQYFA